MLRVIFYGINYNLDENHKRHGIYSAELYTYERNCYVDQNLMTGYLLRWSTTHFNLFLGNVYMNLKAQRVELKEDVCL